MLFSFCKLHASASLRMSSTTNPLEQTMHLGFETGILPSESWTIYHSFKLSWQGELVISFLKNYATCLTCYLAFILNIFKVSSSQFTI